MPLKNSSTCAFGGSPLASLIMLPLLSNVCEYPFSAVVTERKLECSISLMRLRTRKQRAVIGGYKTTCAPSKATGRMSSLNLVFETSAHLLSFVRLDAMSSVLDVPGWCWPGDKDTVSKAPSPTAPTYCPKHDSWNSRFKGT